MPAAGRQTRCQIAALTEEGEQKQPHCDEMDVSSGAVHNPRSDDTLAEWLRRRPAKPMCSARVGSNPIGVGNFTFAG